MKVRLILIIQMLIVVSCFSQDKTSIEEVKNYVFRMGIYPDVKSYKAILVTPILEKNNFGVYAFKKKGPHEINRLLFRQGNKYEIIDKDSSVVFIENRTEQYLLSNDHVKSEEKELKKQIQELIIDYKESDFIN